MRQLAETIQYAHSQHDSPVPGKGSVAVWLSRQVGRSSPWSPSSNTSLSNAHFLRGVLTFRPAFAVKVLVTAAVPETELRRPSSPKRVVRRATTHVFSLSLVDNGKATYLQHDLACLLYSTSPASVSFVACGRPPRMRLCLGVFAAFLTCIVPSQGDDTLTTTEPSEIEAISQELSACSVR